METRELTQALRNGKLGEALARLEGERVSAVQRGDLASKAEAENDLGVVYYLSGINDKARGAFEGSRDDFTRLNNQLGRARATGNLARVEERSKNRTAALALYQEAAALFHEAGEHADEFATLRSLSRLYLKMGGWIQALAAYDRGLAIKPGKSPIDVMLRWLYRIPLQMMGLA